MCVQVLWGISQAAPLIISFRNSHGVQVALSHSVCLAVRGVPISPPGPRSQKDMSNRTFHPFHIY